MVNAQGKIDEAAEGNEQMQEAMTGMNYLPSDFWAGGAGHTANVNAGMGQDMAAMRRLWEEGKAKQQDIIDKVNEQLGGQYGGGGGWGGGSGGGGGGGTWDEGGGGDDGGGRDRPPRKGPLQDDVIIPEDRRRPPVSGDPRIKGMPPGLPQKGQPQIIDGGWDRRGGQNKPEEKPGPENNWGRDGVDESGRRYTTADGGERVYLDKKGKPTSGGNTTMLNGGGGQGSALPPPDDWQPKAGASGGGGGGNTTMQGDVEMPNFGGGQPQSSVTGPSREEFWEQKYAESAANKQRQQDFRTAQNERFEQINNESDARSKQQSLDNMQRNFDMMTPQQRTQNADQFQSTMDKWQSRYGDQGGNTRAQGELFNRIADGIGSNQARQFQRNAQPQQPSLQNLSNQAQGQGANIGQSMSPNQQKVFAKQTQNRIASNRNTPAMQDRRSTGAAMQTSAPSQMASPTMTTKATGMQSGGLNRLANRSKNRMTLPQLYRK
jgi:hypothetical protein